jgi:hypothetical protein
VKRPQKHIIQKWNKRGRSFVRWPRLGEDRLACSSPSRTFRSRINPGLDQPSEQLLRSRSRLSPGSGMPSPSDKIVSSCVFVQQCERATAVTIRIFDLLADVVDRLFLPRHFDGSHSPPGVTGYAAIGSPVDEGKVTIRMTRATCKSWDAEAAVSPSDGRHVRVHIIALRWSVACRVAVHASRAPDHLCHFVENGT